MRYFTNVHDLGDLKSALAEAFEIKKDRYKYETLGKHKTCLLIFFNNSLRTRLSTQKAARNLGMDVIVLDVNQGAWKLETERGVIMDGDKSEHLLEAIPVMASYCDIIGVRSFAHFENREDDYTEKILNQFIKYSGKPVFSMEAATGHPLQAFADLITIEEYKKKDRPKVVLTWAPHPRALPQAVPNSFADWMNEADVDFVITHPEGYELDPKFVRGAKVEYNQMKAFEGADFVFFFWLASMAIFWISSSLSSSSEMNITSNSVPVISAIHTLRGRRYFFSIYSTLAFIFTNINTVLSITSYTFKGCIHVVKDTLDNSCSILRCSIISGHFSCTMFISANS